MRSEPLRIGLFVSHYPYPSQEAGYFAGGTGEVTRGLAHALANRGHEVHVFAVSATGKSEEQLESGVAIHRAGSAARVAQANLSVSIMRKPFEYDLDVVHVHAGNPPAPLAGAFYARRRDVPLILTYHGDPQRHYGTFGRRLGVLGWEPALRWLLRSADQLLCPSGPFVASSRFLAKHAKRVLTVPNGINLEEFAWQESVQEARSSLGLPSWAKVILFLGALSPYKAPDLLMQATLPVLRACPEAMLVFAGSGSMEDELKRGAMAAGMGDRIRFLGFVSGDMRLRAYRAADVFALPSVMTTEVFPMVLLEASAFELPLVVSDLPTFGAMVTDGQNGLVTPRGDSDALGRAIKSLLADDALRDRLGAAARDQIRTLDWPALAERHEEIYRHALSRSSGLSLAR